MKGTEIPPQAVKRLSAGHRFGFSFIIYHFSFIIYFFPRPGQPPVILRTVQKNNTYIRIITVTEYAERIEDGKRAPGERYWRKALTH